MESLQELILIFIVFKIIFTGFIGYWKWIVNIDKEIINEVTIYHLLYYCLVELESAENHTTKNF